MLTRKAIYFTVLAPFLALAQERTVPSPLAGTPLEPLKIVVLEGAGATNSVLDPQPSMVVVEVHDQNDRPVEGAEVTFELPMAGPGGSFATGVYAKSARTTSQGQAGVTYLPNPQVGRFDIKVSAKLGDRTGQTVIHQANGVRVPSSEEKHRFGKLSGWRLPLIIGGAGAAVAVVVILARGSSSSSTTPPTITLTPGTPTFGSP